MKMSVTIITNFSASHTLPNHDGKCSNLHGHNYKVEVTVSDLNGQVKVRDNGSPFYVNPREIASPNPISNSGMVVDFSTLKSYVNSFIKHTLDHRHLNDIIPNPTAENTAAFIYSKIFEILQHSMCIHLDSVKVWETETSYAEIKG